MLRDIVYQVLFLNTSPGSFPRAGEWITCSSLSLDGILMSFQKPALCDVHAGYVSSTQLSTFTYKALSTP